MLTELNRCKNKIVLFTIFNSIIKYVYFDIILVLISYINLEFVLVQMIEITIEIFYCVAMYAILMKVCCF